MSKELEDILLLLYEVVKKKGATPNCVYFQLNPGQPEFNQIEQELDIGFGDIQRIVKNAIAEGYLCHSSKDQNCSKMFTEKGLQFVEKASKKKNRTHLKKASDWIEEHNGLSTLYAAIVGTLSFIIALAALFKTP